MSEAPEFDHRDQGTAEGLWREALPGLIGPLDDAGLEHLVVLAAHPDDESLGAGGLLARAAARGIDVTVIIATSGEGSHPESPTHTPAGLAEVREAEARAAVAVLAPTAALQFLRLPDGGLAGHAVELTRALERRVAAGGTGTWLAAPLRGDGHTDHDAAGLAAADVAERTGCALLEYPIWLWHWGSPGNALLTGAVALTLTGSELETKRRALQDYRSQVLPLSDAPGDEAVVPPAFREHFDRDVEVFLVSGLGAGSRVAASGGARGGESLDRAFFDDFYTGGADPWGFEDRWYERRKRAVTLAALPRARFRRAFEPGCSIGVLTAELAPRCDELLSTDIAQAPLERARQRLAGSPHVRFEQRTVPRDWPAGLFDLIVVSEIGYYCSRADLAELVRRSAEALTPDGVLLTCHWRHPVADYPLRGDEVQAAFRASSGLTVIAEHVEADFRLDLLVRPVSRPGIGS
ncbi:PIG-L family deacetylase [Nakamurella flavida]|uniref:PIG-L family deacetylase n=1 Tax=Nakamurella flavida TaxID=363630 RepID=A0A938YN13_9ACTN|nr:PIG-L family deacetylase [Nakamurella flavida]MBM9476367.1 PIG-L family deacetylase [Nakamurella flavida]MDP9779533.1 LmbE family N-acetylglucosaminyl deacetylase [Nakamurella flavida]